jgi:hypothetical protein
MFPSYILIQCSKDDPIINQKIYKTKYIKQKNINTIMNYRQLCDKCFEESREKSFKTKMIKEQTKDSEILTKIHEYALNNMAFNVQKVLDHLGVSYNQYAQLIKTGLSIPTIRQLRTGKTRNLTENAKQQLEQARLVKKNKTKPKQKSKKRTHEYLNGEGSEEYAINDLIQRQFK